MEARNLKSKCLQDHIPLSALGKNLSLPCSRLLCLVTIIMLISVPLPPYLFLHVYVFSPCLLQVYLSLDSGPIWIIQDNLI